MASGNAAAAVAERRALVTGGTGFIGRLLCRRLADLGAEVHVASRRRQQLGAGLTWVEMDTSDPGAVAGVFADVRPELVFHLAGLVTGSRELEHVEPTLRANLVGVVNVLTAAQATRASRVVLAGSMEAPRPGGADTPPSSPYAASKWAADGYARMFHRLYGSPVVTLRVFMVYGPGTQDETKLVPYVIRSVLAGESPKLSSGSREVDWVYVDDVVEAFVAAAVAADVDGGEFDVGSGAAVTVRDVVERIIKLAGSRVVPAFGAIADRRFETATVADIGPTAAALGWRPRTGLDQGLKRTHDWFRDAGSCTRPGATLR